MAAMFDPRLKNNHSIIMSAEARESAIHSIQEMESLVSLPESEGLLHL